MYSSQRIVSDGTLTFVDISIPFISRSDIVVNVTGIDNPVWSWSGPTGNRIVFDSPVEAGKEVLIIRKTVLSDLLNVFSTNAVGGGAAFNAITIDENFRQLLYSAQEAYEAAILTGFLGDVSLNGYRITDLGDAVNDTDAVNLGQYKRDFDTILDAATRAEEAAERADQIMNLSIAVDDAPYGQVASGSYNPLTGMLTLRVPAGPEGLQGPIGLQGTQGPQGITGERGPVGETGPMGNNGVIITMSGLYGFEIVNGDLVMVYDEGGTPPNLTINADGNLIWEG